ncbi:MAG: FeoB small GTPase domain-containing protein [Dehalococcoidales bacterium]|jgi:ferrous iron transport protein B|nr:iron transporter [Dehalococcoidales bacterium]MDP6824741.1 FeoB small GTPase domain-containing protein [Dehalococcoidales bacterium]MDP7415499.1 FeoB small GTPase domain-containing protein [Dehalococcoidales bacterium]|tara:strand:- start:3158 stop:3757 length:600 start_codon:yes stop_codon:yes gene_type:complete
MALWEKVLKTISFGKSGGGCHWGEARLDNNHLSRVGIVGNPNVGKSVVFNNLTGAYVTVSNYPGTTVDVARGKAKIEGVGIEVVDTPGMYSLLPITEEERVARLILFEERPEVILHVVDSKNLERMLPLTIQFIEARLPVILDLNMMDETEVAGIEIDVNRLEKELGIPVVATVATAGRGMATIRKRLVEYVRNQNYAV